MCACRPEEFKRADNFCLIWCEARYLAPQSLVKPQERDRRSDKPRVCHEQTPTTSALHLRCLAIQPYAECMAAFAPGIFDNQISGRAHQISPATARKASAPE